jgi:hypothetical protein
MDVLTNVSGLDRQRRAEPVVGELGHEGGLFFEESVAGVGDDRGECLLMATQTRWA